MIVNEKLRVWKEKTVDHITELSTHSTKENEEDHENIS
jgi:hypothetical protein